MTVTPRKRRKFTAAERAEISRRMKAAWARRRAIKTNAPDESAFENVNALREGIEIPLPAKAHAYIVRDGKPSLIVSREEIRAFALSVVSVI